jgi:hypothetical protein
MTNKNGILPRPHRVVGVLPVVLLHLALVLALRFQSLLHRFCLLALHLAVRTTLLRADAMIRLRA